MLLRQIFDGTLAQYTYLIGCPATGEALIVDPERDIDRYLRIAADEDLEITAVAETHIHADFLSGARELAERSGIRVYLSGAGGPEWQYAWPAEPREEDGERRDDGEPDDVTLLQDGDTFRVGEVEVRAVHTPGHTPEHLSYLVVDRGAGASGPMGLISGDFVFVGDLGRPDLLEQAAGHPGIQEESARTLYRSLPRFLELDDHLQVWPGHGSGSSCGKSLAAVPTTTVGYEKRHNDAIAAASDGEDAFVEAILSGQREPPMYFGRMKRENREGPAILGSLPRPQRLAVAGLDELEGGAADGPLVVDTRSDRSAYMARHLAGSLYAPLDRTFSTVVGSLVTDAARPLVLVIDEEDVEEAVRALVRIGHDRVTGFVEPDTLQRYLGRPDAPLETIGEIDLEAMERLRAAPGTVVLDVRYASEYHAGHVPGAVNASYTRLPEYLDDRIPPEGTLLVHCSTGSRSAAASAWLAARGRDVRYVNDDWKRWSGEDRPVERTRRSTEPAPVR